jgi:hypothetical protein
MLRMWSAQNLIISQSEKRVRRKSRFAMIAVARLFFGAGSNNLVNHNLDAAGRKLRVDCGLSPESDRIVP